MQLLLIRHGIAEDLGAPGVRARTDAERALTDVGVARMRKGAAGLATLVDRIDVLVESPLVRARETADIVAKATRVQRRETTDVLEPERHPREVLGWLERAAGEAALVACCGHEPLLSSLVSYALTGRLDAAVTMKKGGAALLTFAGAVRAGEGILEWLLAPSQLRGLAP